MRGGRWAAAFPSRETAPFSQKRCVTGVRGVLLRDTRELSPGEGWGHSDGPVGSCAAAPPAPLPGRAARPPCGAAENWFQSFKRRSWTCPVGLPWLCPQQGAGRSARKYLEFCTFCYRWAFSPQSSKSVFRSGEEMKSVKKTMRQLTLSR